MAHHSRNRRTPSHHARLAGAQAEVISLDDELSLEVADKMRDLLDALFDEGSLVYRGYVDDPCARRRRQ
eukprot:4695784-Prymnesium_polylepis.1